MDQAGTRLGVEQRPGPLADLAEGLLLRRRGHRDVQVAVDEAPAVQERHPAERGDQAAHGLPHPTQTGLVEGGQEQVEPAFRTTTA